MALGNTNTTDSCETPEASGITYRGTYQIPQTLTPDPYQPVLHSQITEQDPRSRTADPTSRRSRGLSLYRDGLRARAGSPSSLGFRHERDDSCNDQTCDEAADCDAGENRAVRRDRPNKPTQP